MLPVSTDGNRVKKEGFMVAGILLHQGAHQSQGHYLTIQNYYDIQWLCDDNAPPVPIERMTKKMRQQVLQIWLIKKELHVEQMQLSPVSCPADVDEQSPEAETPTQRVKRQKPNQNLTLSMCNVTSYSKEVEKWVMTKQQPIFLVETHLEGQDLHQKLQSGHQG